MDREAVAELLGEETIILDGLEAAVIGYGQHHTQDHEVLIYSYSKMVDVFVDRDGMDYETACEWIDFNVIRGLPYMGPHAPIVVYDSEATRDMIGLDIQSN